MRARAGILVVVLAASLSGCGSSGSGADAGSDPTRLSSPSAPVTEVTVDCPRYTGIAAKIAAAQSKIFTPGNEAEATAAVDALKAELDGLKDGAPADVVAALDDLSAMYGDIVEAIKNPNGDAQAHLASMASKLSEDGQKISAYIVSRCTS